MKRASSSDFDFRIGSPSKSNSSINKMIFQYWPQRLVELSSFTVKIDKDTPFHSSMDNKGGEHAYKLRVFCGFDRMRINGGIYAEKAASLYIYSRQSGRLITYEEDGRNSLGMSNGSSNYCQGLTIIIDDIEGKLPLNPTKQELAFGEQEDGDIHEANMKAWVSCVSKFYYDYHFAKFNNLKTVLTNKVKAFGSEELPSVKGIDNSQLTTFEPKYKVYGRVKKSIIVDKRKAISIITGRDTRFKLLPDPPPPPPPPPPIVNPASAHAAQQPFQFQPIVNTGSGKKRRVEQQPPPAALGGVNMQMLVGSNVQIAQQVLGQMAPNLRPGPGRNPQPQLQQEQNVEMMDPLLQMNLHSLQRPRRQQPVATGQPSSQSTTSTEVSTQQQQGTVPPTQAPVSSDKQPVTVGNNKTSTKKGDNTKDGIEIIDLAADSGAEDNTVPPSSKSTQNSASNVKEEEPNAAAAASNDNNEDMDEDSVASTKDYYKDFCTQLTAKLVVKNEACSKMRKENKQLKKEMKRVKSDHEKAMKKAEEKVQKLRKEIEQLRLDAARSVTE